MTITKERFEAWLFSQPRERQFVYTSSSGCLICSFLKETVKGNWSVGSYTYGLLCEADTYGLLCEADEPIPDWLWQLVEKVRYSDMPFTYTGILTIASAQDTFLAMNITSKARQTDMATGLAITPTQEGCLNVSCTT